GRGAPAPVFTEPLRRRQLLRGPPLADASRARRRARARALRRREGLRRLDGERAFGAQLRAGEEEARPAEGAHARRVGEGRPAPDVLAPALGDEGPRPRRVLKTRG